MLKAIVLTGAAITATAVLSAAHPATAARSQPHLYYVHADHSLTLCGRHDHTPVGPADNSYQVRNTYWRGTGPTCIRTVGDDSTGFTVTRTPAPTKGRSVVTTYPAVFRGCIWDMCTKNTPLPARADHLRTVSSSWRTVYTRTVTTTPRRTVTRTTHCLPATRRIVTTRHKHRHVHRRTVRGRVITRITYTYTYTRTPTCLVHLVRNVPLPGTYNTSYDLWFGRHRMTQGHADGAELMIWLNHSGGCCVLRRDAPIVTIDGVRYYFQWWRPSDPAAHLSWNYLQFRRVVQTGQVTNLNLRSFVTFAEHAHPAQGQRHPLINPLWWLENLNGGFEIWNGGAGLRTTSFTAHITTG